MKRNKKNTTGKIEQFCLKNIGTIGAAMILANTAGYFVYLARQDKMAKDHFVKTDAEIEKYLGNNHAAEKPQQ